MEKNMMIMLVAIIVIAVVAIVAVVLMMGNKGTTTTPGTPTVPTTPTAPAGPLTPQTGSNVICDITYSGSVEGQQMSMSGTTKIEGRKMRSDMTMAAEGLTMDIKVIINENMMYMYSPMTGGWLQMDANTNPEAAAQMTNQLDQLQGKSPQEVADYMTGNVAANPELAGGVVPTYICRATGDVPDSEFQLPAGVTPIDMSEALAGMNAETEANVETAQSNNNVLMCSATSCESDADCATTECSAAGGATCEGAQVMGGTILPGACRTS